MKVQLLNYMGNDNSIVDAARVSFSKTSINYTEEQNKALINYLARGVTSNDIKQMSSDLAHTLFSNEDAERIIHHLKNIPTHWTPFAHTALSFRVTAPISIRTQCFKHKQGLVENEESRRYITSTPELFIPEYFRNKADNIKQGSEGIHADNKHWINEYIYAAKKAIGIYEEMIFAGVAPEQARFILPQGVEVTWIWTGNLYAFANFYNKRSDSHAQKEIQDLAEEFNKIIKPLFPYSWEALTKGI